MKLAAVILAAGSGTRLGGVAKALLPCAGAPGDVSFLARIVETARAAGLVDAVVVVGPPFGDEVAAHARALGVRVVDNPEPGRGMASSVALGFAAVELSVDRSVDAAWLWPVDHPYVAVATLRALVGALGDHDVAQPRFGGRGGHPPLVARVAWPALARCGEGGARAVFAAADVIAVPVDDAGVVRDLDTPADRRAM